MFIKIELKHICKIIFFVVIFLITLLTYGIWPGQWGSFPGSVDFGVPHLSFSQIFHNNNLAYPLGNFYPQGYPFIVFRMLLCYIFNITEYLAAQIELSIILLISYWGTRKLLIKLGVNSFIASILSFVFILLPINLGHMQGFLQLSKSFLLIPPFLLFDFTLHKYVKICKDKKKWFVYSIILYFITKSFFLFCNGYAFVFANIMSLFLLINYVAENKFGKWQNLLIFFCIFILANITAFILYDIYIPGDAVYTKESIDFFRGQGVDIISLLLPSDNLFFSNTVGLSKHWISNEFYGDGSNVRFNYIGYSFITILILSIVLHFSNKKNIYIIIFSLFTTLLISLGPSLKINDTRDKNSLIKNGYHMKKDEATLYLGTDFIYKFPGIRNMRSVYRWIYLVKLFLLILAGIILTELYENKRNKKWGYLLAILVVVEFLPNLNSIKKRREKFYNMGNALSEEFTNSLNKYFNTNDKVFIYSKNNDFLAEIIGNRYSDIKLYNAKGDKKNYKLKKSYPNKLFKLYKADSRINDLLYDAFISKNIDLLVLPYFSLRLSFYHWPPKEFDEYKKSSKEKFNFSDNRFRVINEKYYSIITLNSNYQKDIDFPYNMKENLHAANLTGQKYMENPWGKRIAQVEEGIFVAPNTEISYSINIKDTHSLLFVTGAGFYPKAKDWGISDGARMLILIHYNNINDTIFNEYILPQEKLKNIEANLQKYYPETNNVFINLKVIQDRNKSSRGDWLYWHNPRLINKN